MRRYLLLALVVAGAFAPCHQARASFLNRSLDDWLKELESTQPQRRRSAAFAIGRLSNGALALPRLSDLVVRDPEDPVRDMAAAAIGDLVSAKDADVGYAWSACGRALLTALEHRSPRVRRSAVYALGAFGPTAGGTVAELRKALKDDSPSVRQNAAWALGRVGRASLPALTDLSERLNDRDVLVKRDAATALGSIARASGREVLRPAADSLFALAKREKDTVVLKAGLEALALVASDKHRDQAGDLYELLNSRDAEVARGAGYVLGNMGGEPARKALMVLRKALLDPDDTVKAVAAATLANAGNEAVPLVDDLATTLKSCKEPVVRRNCAIALAQLGASARPAVPALVEALKPVPGAPATGPGAQPYEEVREQAAEALAKIRYPANGEAIPALREAIRKDANQLVRQRCIWALFQLRELDAHGLTDVLTTVLAETGDRSLMVRYDSARLLAAALTDKAPDRVVDTLLHMIENKTLRVFYGTGAAVEGTGNEAGGGRSSATASSGGDARYMAAEAMGWLGDRSSKNEKVVKALRDAVKDGDAKLKEAAEKAMEELKIK